MVLISGTSVICNDAFFFWRRVWYLLMASKVEAECAQSVSSVASCNSSECEGLKTRAVVASIGADPKSIEKIELKQNIAP